MTCNGDDGGMSPFTGWEARSMNIVADATHQPQTKLETSSIAWRSCRMQAAFPHYKQEQTLLDLIPALCCGGLTPWQCT